MFPWVNLQSVKACRVSRIRGWFSGARPLYRRRQSTRHGLWRRAALAARPRQNQVDRRPTPPRPRPACLPSSPPPTGRSRGLGESARRIAGSNAATARPMFKPRYPVLAEDRVRWVGDPRRLRRRRNAGAGAGRRRADRRSITRRCPRSSRPPRRPKPGAPRVWDDCPDNICFVELIGDKAATDAAFAKAAHVVKHRFVINRVTAATMEPRGAVGVYRAGGQTATSSTPPMQRPHPLSRRTREDAEGPREQGARHLPATPAAASA